MSERCILCNECTGDKFQTKSLCLSCKRKIIKTNSQSSEWFYSNTDSNTVCEYCYEKPSKIALSGSSYSIICLECSTHFDTIIPIHWLNLIQSTRNPLIYEERLIQLNQNFNPAREGILASITDVIFELNKLYKLVIEEIDSNEEKNLKILEDFEKKILEKSNDLQQNLPSSWSEEMQIFTVNLESYLSDMVSTDLLQPNELEKLIKEKVKLEISQTDDFSYLLAD